MRLLILFLIVLLSPHIAFADEDSMPPELADPTPPPAPSSERHSWWGLIVPAFVVHGLEPVNDAQAFMPRKLDPNGRSVATPGLGIDYHGKSSFTAVAGVVKDCYDDWAGTIQIGQYLKLGSRTEIGYTIGLYIRQTPIVCFTETDTVISGGGVGPIHAPLRKNTFTSTTCGFSDNFPVRYTFATPNGYVDVIPSPFINFATALYKSPHFQVDLKLMSNFYLNEFGLGFPF